MGRDLHQRRHGVDKDDEELFDSDPFLSNSDDDDDSEDDDASAPTSAPANMNSDGALSELSALMEHLPIKRGLSRYYQGKSQSYTSLSAVSSIEDLPKKESPYKRKMMKACKSYAGGLDARQRSPHTPGPCSKTSSKKAPRVASCASLMSKSSSSSVFCSSKPPPIRVQKNQCSH
ncbi:uncharacterized protein LOC122036166 [Zingiber officinale]|uniref:Oxidative stress 3 n=1 Tax=Zingiber officinale TaxID=94328 RepID=A0A8J5I7D9_ZINOF|nr:uncharacterized protein LOC122036166 [Zingiber officinale]KAG6537639.1 hypothetical protein ZIOFF_002734 [Zingiber officinale]